MKRNVVLLLLFLVLCWAVSIGLRSYLQSQDRLVELAKENNQDRAVALFDSFIMSRSWNDKVGGVYIRQQENVKSNPYLKNSHLTTVEGELLVRVNAAWMIRQMMELGAHKPGYHYRITGLNPLNPENRPDSFESEALHFFEQHHEDSYFFRFSKDLANLDFMGALRVTPKCLLCHSQQGYQLGDNLGGIRITLPTPLLHAQARQINQQSEMTIISVIAITVLLFLVISGLVVMISNRQLAIQSLNDSLNTKVAERTSNLEQVQKQLSDELQFQQMRAELYNLLIGTEYSVDKLRARILSNAKQLTASPWALAGEISSSDAELHCHFEVDADLAGNQSILKPTANGDYPRLWGHNVNTKQSFRCNRPVTHWLDGESKHEDLPLNRVMSIPVIFNDVLLGQLAVANKKTDYDGHDQQLLERLANFYALSIHFLRTEAALRLTRKKEQQYLQEVQRLSITDPLTSLYNRRHFREMFTRRLNLAKRLKLFFGLLILDIDFFKHYNDRYGHLAGDHALVDTARTISEQMRRSTEQAFRVGGEEFCCLVLGENREDIIHIAESIRLAIRERKIEHLDNTPHRILTVSIGLKIVSEYDHANYDNIYKEADDALYNAKRQGRDQVYVV